ncbi:alpha/beta-hydrolase [Mycena olivaceomarginata]|nr:alpha/beta-hydrolase [Mycena olivaceomarginata]
MLSLLPIFCLLPAALALPMPIFGLGDSTADDTATDKPTPFSLDAVNSTLLRPAQFARSIAQWSCGAPCDALKNITFLQSGGDQGLVPLYFIAHDPDDQSLVVAHEGTDAKNIKRSSARQTSLLAGVMSGLKSTGVKKVVVTGHSLGAALATMTGAMIKDAVDPSVDVSVTGFGLPRGGNQAWADFLDSQVGVTFVSNQNDPVPTVPPKFLGFQHTSGEIHIVDDSQTNLIACPGQDNENCATGNNVLDVSVQNHLGPVLRQPQFRGSQCSS